MSIATVMGPTPPGTGVIARVFGLTESKRGPVNYVIVAVVVVLLAAGMIALILFT